MSAVFVKGKIMSALFSRSLGHVARMNLGHVARMNLTRKAKQVLNWTPGRKGGKGRPRKNWPETIRGDLRILELTREDALDAAEDRDGCAQHRTD